LEKEESQFVEQIVWGKGPARKERGARPEEGKKKGGEGEKIEIRRSKGGKNL